jgi:hypothetical protein
MNQNRKNWCPWTCSISFYGPNYNYTLVVMLGVVMLSVVAPFSVIISNVNKELIKDSLQA